MPSRLYRGSSLRGSGKITRTQTKAQARKSIRKKYGTLKDGALYYHRGDGEWAQYKPSRDKKRTTQGRKKKNRPLGGGHLTDYAGRGGL